jgi:hypothetical protein
MFDSRARRRHDADQSEEVNCSLAANSALATEGGHATSAPATLMPILSNPRHERFAQELANGKTASDAYTAAGYKPSRANASTLRTNQNI